MWPVLNDRAMEWIMKPRKKLLDIEYMSEVWKEDRAFVARAVPLDVMSCGRSTEEAYRNLREAVHLFVTTAVEQGTLPAILRECGYRRTRAGWQAPRLLAREQVRQQVTA
jgi:predicted RNase H-like HicB family nuclease